MAAVSLALPSPFAPRSLTFTTREEAGLIEQASKAFAAIDAEDARAQAATMAASASLAGEVMLTALPQVVAWICATCFEIVSLRGRRASPILFACARSGRECSLAGGLLDHLGNAARIFIGEVGMHGKAHDLFADGLADRQRAFAAPVLCIRRLEVHWLRVVDHGRDAGLGERFLKGRALVRLDGVLGPSGTQAIDAFWHGDHALQSLVVDSGDALPRLKLAVEHGEFDRKDRRLNAVETAVEADAINLVSIPSRAMNADRLEHIGKVVIVGEDGTAVAIGAERLRRKEARAADRRERADSVVVIGATERLGGIGDQMQAFALGERVETVPVRRETEEVDRDDRFRLELAGGAGLGDLPLEIREIDVERVRLDVDEDGRRAGEQDHFGRGREGKGRHEHGITRPHTISE